MGQSVVVHLDKFSGPMALLLHLIKQQEMNIFDINIHEITKQYLDSIRAMKKLNLEMAGDFVAMAATLIQIKSKMLLPQYNEDGEVVETEDPRQDLVKRLLEYQKFQDASHALNQRDLLGRNLWARGMEEDLTQIEDEIVMEEENALFSLISAYRMAIKNINKAVHKVSESLQSIAERIWEMRSILVPGRLVGFFELLQDKPDRRGHVLITFLSLLELAKVGVINLFQSENFADIHIDTRKEIDANLLSRVEDYNTQAQSREVVVDVWLQEDERKGDDLPLFSQFKSDIQDGEGIVGAATDDDIALEELKYEETKQRESDGVV